MGEGSPRQRQHLPSGHSAARRHGEEGFAPLPTDRIPGHQLLHLLGEGGMGKVYLARDEALDREVAVKLLSADLSWEEEARARFLREARVMAALEHLHVVRIYASGEIDGRPYFVMEYVPGETLAHRIWSAGPLPIPLALRIASESVQALQAAWERGIVHRDIKPSNIMLDAGGRVKVTDFGLAKPTRWRDEITLSEAGVLLCTPCYVSPEQAQAAAEIDFRADIYSLGIVLFEMLTGERPFQGGSAMAVVVKAMSTPLPDLRSRRPEVPEEVAALVEWMTRKLPGARPQSYEDLDRRLAALQQQEESTGEFSSTAPATPAFLEAREDPAAAWAEPFVGREQELDRLDEHLGQACGGNGRIVFVTGEAGTGKTSLLAEHVCRAVQAHPELVAINVGSAARGRVGDPYGPFREALALLTGDLESPWRAGRLPRAQAIRLWDAFPVSARALVEAGPDLLGPLVDPEALRRRAESAAAPGTPWVERLRGATDRAEAHAAGGGTLQPALFAQTVRFLGALACQKPLLIVLDDLQWTDSASLGLLAAIGSRLEGMRLLIVGSYRESEIASDDSGVRHPLEQVVNEMESMQGQSRLNLDQAGDRAFSDALVDREPNTLGDGFRRKLFERTGGHALFTVELLRALAQQGMLRRNDEGRWRDEADGIDWNLIPARVEAVIRERLGRLSPCLREILSAASVEGEVFPAAAVARVVGLSPGEVIRHLSEDLGAAGRLVGLEALRRFGGATVPLYRFSHALFQTHLYEHLDEARRVHLHGAMGEALEELFEGNSQEVASQLARHFKLAGRIDKAIRYACEAGLRATRLSAFEEALGRFGEALALLAELPEGSERDRHELEILLASADPLVAARGWAHPEVARAIDRAMPLARSLADRARLSDLLILRAHHDAVCLRYLPALANAREGLRFAIDLDDEARLASARIALGVNLFYVGEFEPARKELERVLAFSDRRGDGRPLPGVAGTDSIAIALAWLGHTLRLLGYPEQADQHYRKAIARAEELDQAHTIALVRMHGQFPLVEHGRYALAEKNLAALEQLTARRGLVPFSMIEGYFRGWLLACQGRPSEGAALMQKVFGQDQGGALPGISSVMLRDLSAAWLAAGEVEPGLQTISSALEVVGASGERFVEAELHRVRAGLLLAHGGDNAEQRAEACLQHALQIARGQKARAWELRAAMGLGRLWHQQDKTAEARDLVQPVYDGFNEGFDTRDLEQARNLLESWA